MSASIEPQNLKRLKLLEGGQPPEGYASEHEFEYEDFEGEGGESREAGNQRILDNHSKQESTQLRNMVLDAQLLLDVSRNLFI